MLQLNPRFAVFRSAPNRVTIGAQSPSLELPADQTHLAALAALMRGVLPQEFEQMMGSVSAAEILGSLRPVLQSETPLVSIKVRGRLPVARTMQRAARAAGHASGRDLIVPVAPWRLPAREVERLVEQESAHLPVIVGDSWIDIGPYSPGDACIRCVGSYDGGVVPAHLVPVPSPPARWQTVAAVLTALRLASLGDLRAGWGMRISQASGVINELPARPSCRCRSRRGIARAA